MSKTIDINQLLDEIGTSSRSASDPWTLSRSSQLIGRSPGNPTLLADMGAPVQELLNELQLSAEIRNAKESGATTSPAAPAASNSIASGILGGLLHIFPLASGIAKLFGFGSTSPGTLSSQYELPPALAFTGTLSGPGSTVANLSYGADGQPRVTSPAAGVPAAALAAATVPATASQFINSSPELLANVTEFAGAPRNTPNVFGDQSSETSVHQPERIVVSPNSERGGNTVVRVNDGLAWGSRDARSDSVGAELHSLASSNFPIEQASAQSLLVPDLGVPTDSGAGRNPGANLDANSFRTDAGAGSVYNGAAENDSGVPGSRNILVQVHAMDSQSFMDHSQEIAQAVRQAMLNMNSLNDVILDL